MLPTRLLLAVSVALTCHLGTLLSCGMAWSPPRSHFDGVNSNGHVMFSVPMGDVEIGPEQSLPIYAVFNSSKNTSSPIAGMGWQVPLLESTIVQVDENTFKLEQPDGWNRLFWRNKKNPALLNGQANWKAEIKGNVITAWADCGSTKLTFEKGTLRSLQIKDRKVEYIYEGKRIVELRHGNKSLLSIERTPGTDYVAALSLGDSKRIQLGHTNRPKVQHIERQNLIAGECLALGSVVPLQGLPMHITYGVTPDANPTINLNGREISWNAATKLVLKDGSWAYDIAPASPISTTPVIQRRLSTGQTESWQIDRNRGLEIKRDLYGVQTLTSWFTSGQLEGKLRKVEKLTNNERTVIRQLTYDEKGRIIREHHDGVDYVLEYSEGAVTRKRLQASTHADGRSKTPGLGEDELRARIKSVSNSVERDTYIVQLALVMVANKRKPEEIDRLRLMTFDAEIAGIVTEIVKQRGRSK